MSFYIVRTDGTVLTVINDGELNTDSTPLYLPGRNYPGYGSVIDTNFVRQLENFAFGLPPSNALKGQLWFNTNNDSLYVCPTDGETDPDKWFKIYTINNDQADLAANSLVLSGDIWANNAHIANTVNANLIDTDYLTVRIQANIANANITGLTEIANLVTNNITTGSNVTSGTITGAWTVNGSLQTEGNVSAGIFQSDSYRYANGQVINFDAASGGNGLIQFSTNGSLDSSSDLVFNRDLNTLFVANAISVGVDITSPTFTGSAVNLSNLPAGNIVGVLPEDVQSAITRVGVLPGLTVTGNVNTNNLIATTNVIASTLTGNLSTAAQPNITSVGTLTSLAVTGTVTAGQVEGGALVRANLLAGTLTTASSSQPNVTSVGTLTSLTVTGNIISSSNIYANSGTVKGAFLTGTITTPEQTNITKVGTLQNVNVDGNVTTGNMYATGTVSGSSITGTLTTAYQPNITSVGTLTNLDVAGNVVSGNVYANSGTVQSAFLTGTLTTSAQTNITRVGALQSLVVDGNTTTGNLYTSGTVSGSLITGTLTTESQTNITQVGTLSSLAVATTITAQQVISNFVGDGSSLSSLTGANVTGQVAFANVANNVTVSNIAGIGNVSVLNLDGNPGNVLYGNGVFAIAPLNPYGDNNVVSLLSSFGSNTINTTGDIAVGNITAGQRITTTLLTGTLTASSSSQPNITSIGTLNLLTVTGNVNAGNIIGKHFGNGASLTSITGENVTGIVDNAAYANNAGNATRAGTVTNPSQGNITSVGTLTSLSVSGSLTAGTATVSGNTNFSQGTQQVRDVIKQVTLSGTGITGAVNVDLIGPSTTFYNANSAGNWTFNFRGNSSVAMNSYLGPGRSAIATVLVKQGPTAYYPTGFTIDGTPITPKWINGVVPFEGNPNGINAYTFTIIKTASASYTVLATVEWYSDTLPLPTSADRTCIAVIDESSPDATTISNSWTSFRTNWPQRPFYLLQPGGPAQGSLKQPASFTADPIAYGPITVNRDNGVAGQASDWYTICNIDKLPNGSNFALWIDNSGSMTNATVQASINLLNSKIAPRSITYTLMTDGGENWVTPFNKNL